MRIFYDSTPILLSTAPVPPLLCYTLYDGIVCVYQKIYIKKGGGGFVLLKLWKVSENRFGGNTDIKKHTDYDSSQHSPILGYIERWIFF